MSPNACSSLMILFKGLINNGIDLIGIPFHVWFLVGPQFDAPRNLIVRRGCLICKLNRNLFNDSVCLIAPVAAPVLHAYTNLSAPPEPPLPETHPPVDRVTMPLYAFDRGACPCIVHLQGPTVSDASTCMPIV